jgi:hypothetical protein
MIDPDIAARHMSGEHAEDFADELAGDLAEDLADRPSATAAPIPHNAVMDRPVPAEGGERGDQEAPRRAPTMWR